MSRPAEQMRPVEVLETFDLPAPKDPAGFDIDLDRPAIENDDGSISTEKTVTVGIDDRFYNIPTIWDGEELAPQLATQRAREAMRRGEQFPNFATIPEAEEAARQRSARIGELRGAAGQPKPDAVAIEETFDLPVPASEQEGVGLWTQFKTGVAGLANATLGISSMIVDSPGMMRRLSSSLEEQWDTMRGVPMGGAMGVITNELANRDINPYRWSTAVFRAIDENHTLKIPEEMGGGELVMVGTGQTSDDMDAAFAKLPEIFPSFQRLGMKGEEVDQATRALIEGKPELMKKALLDPESWAAFVGQGLPSLFLAWKSGGSIPFMAWLEAADQAKSIEQYEEMTGTKVNNAEYATSVLAVGAANSFLEKLGLDAILGKAPGGKTLIGRFIGAMLGEGGTEAIQEINQNAAALAYDPELRAQADDALDGGKWEPFVQSMMKGVVPAAIGGAGVGGLVSTMTSAADRLERRNQKDRLNNAGVTEREAQELGLETVPITKDLLNKFGENRQNTEPLTGSEIYTLTNAGMIQHTESPTGEDQWFLVKKGLDERERLSKPEVVEFVPPEVPPVVPPEIESVTDDVYKRATFSLEDEPQQRALFSKKKREAREQLERAANYAQTSDKNELPPPSEAQIDAGNYRKGHVRFQGLEVSIENPKGSVRERPSFKQTLKDHYGYIRGTVGKDKDHIDAFVGPNAYSQQVYVVNQNKEDGVTFDEHKVMLGYTSMQEARDAYLRNYPPGWKGLDSISPMSMAAFKHWLGTTGPTRKAPTYDPREELKRMDPAAEIPQMREQPVPRGQPFKFDRKMAAEEFKAAFNEMVGKLPIANIRDGRTINLTRTGRDKVMSHFTDPRMRAVWPHIREILGSAVPITTTVSEGKQAHQYGARVMIGGVEHFVKLTVREDSTGRSFLYDFDVTPSHEMNTEKDRGRGFSLSAWWQATDPRKVDESQRMQVSRKADRFRNPKTNAGKGLRKEVARAIVSVFYRYMRNVPNLEVVEAIEDLPAHVQELITQEDRGRITGYYDEGGAVETVYIIANNIDSEQQAIETLFHEYIGHYGMRSVLGSRYDEFMDEVYKAFPKQVHEAAQHQGLDWTNIDQRRIAAEEFIAYTAQTLLNKKSVPQQLRELLNMIVEEIKRIYAMMMGKKEPLTTRQIWSMIREARNYVENPSGYARDVKRGARRSVGDNPYFYSQLFKFLNDDQAKARSPDDYLTYIGKPGAGAVGNGKLKEDEVTWSGVRQFLQTATWDDALRQLDNVWATPAAKNLPVPVVSAWQKLNEAKAARDAAEAKESAEGMTDENIKLVNETTAAFKAAEEEWARYQRERPNKISKELVMAFVQKNGVQLEVHPANTRKEISNQADIDAHRTMWHEKMRRYEEEMAAYRRKWFNEEVEEVEITGEDILTDDEIEEKLDEEFQEPDEIRDGNWHDSEIDDDGRHRINEDNFEEAFTEHIDGLYNERSSEYKDILKDKAGDHGYDLDLTDDEHEHIQELIDNYGARALRRMNEQDRAEAQEQLEALEGSDKDLLETYDADWTWDGTTRDEIETEAQDQYRDDLREAEYSEFREKYENERTIYRWSVGGRYDVTRRGNDENAEYEVYDYEAGDNLGTFSSAEDADEAIKDDWKRRRNEAKKTLEDEREEARERQKTRLEEERLAKEAIEYEERISKGFQPIPDRAALEEAGQQQLPMERLLPPPPIPPEPYVPIEPVYSFVETPIHGSYRLPQSKDYHEWLLTWRNAPPGVRYTQIGHWHGRENFIAHVRWDVRKDLNDDDTMYVDEWQSDWHKEIRNFGVKQPREVFIAELDAIKAKVAEALPEMIAEMKSWNLKGADIAQASGAFRSDEFIYEVKSLLDVFKRENSRVERHLADKRAAAFGRVYERMIAEEDSAREEARRAGAQRPLVPWYEIEQRAKTEAATMEIKPDEGMKDTTWSEFIDNIVNADSVADVNLKRPQARMRALQLYEVTAEAFHLLKHQVAPPDALIKRKDKARELLEEAAQLGDRFIKQESARDPAPFPDTWPLLVVKTMIREAVRRGHKKIHFSVGEIHGLRWGGGNLVPGVKWEMVDLSKGWSEKLTQEELDQKIASIEKDGGMVKLTPIGSNIHYNSTWANVTMRNVPLWIGEDAAQFLRDKIAAGEKGGEISAEKDLGRPNGLMYPYNSEPGSMKRLIGSRGMYNVITPNMVNKWLKPFKTKMKMGGVKMEDAQRVLAGSGTSAAGKAAKTFKAATREPAPDPYAGYQVRELSEDEKRQFAYGDLTQQWYALFDANNQLADFESVGSMTNAMDRLATLRARTQQAAGKHDAFEAWEIEITPELQKAAEKGFPLFMKKYPSPKLNKALDKARNDIFPQLPTGVRRLQKRADQIVKITNKAAKLEQAFVDQFAGIKHAIRAVHGGDLPASQSAYKQAHFTTSIDGQLYALLTHGMFMWKDGITQIKEGSKGLLEILEPVAEHIHEWGYWMAARRAKRLKEEGREHLFDDATIDGLLELSEHHPEFIDVAVEYAKWKAELLDWAQEAGVIDPITRGLWENADHVPFYRIKADELGGAFGRLSGVGGRGIVNQLNPIRRLKGGTDPLGDITENIILNITQLVATTMKNRAGALAIENLKDSGLISPVAGYEFMKKELIDMADLKKKLRAAGVNTAAMPNDALNAMRQMWTVQAPKGDDIISVLVNGKKKYYHVHDETLFRSLTAINVARFSGPVARFLMAPFRFSKRLISSGITLAPGYMAANWIRDTPQSYVNSRYATAPRFDRSVMGFKKAFFEDPEMVNIMAAGGAFYSGYVNALDARATTTAIKRALREKGFKNSIIDAPWKLFDLYQKLGAAAENSNRIGMHYIPAIKAGKGTAEAVWESKDALNFAKHGDLAVVQFLAQTVFAFNARIQGLVRFGQAFKEAPGRTGMRALLYTFATLAIYLAFRDDERYKELSEDEKDLYHHFWLGDDHYRIPKAFELGMIFGTLPERMTEYFSSNEDDKGLLAIDRAKFLFDQVFQLWDPVTVVPAPNLLQPEIERRFNYDFFTRSAIVPEYMQDISGAAPELTYDERTSPTVREMVKYAPDFLPPDFRNPIQLQHLIEGYTGTVGSTVLMMSDDLVRKQFDYPPRPALAWSQYPLIGRFYRADDPPRRSKYEEVIYAVREAARGIDRAITQMEEREYTPEQIEEFENAPSVYSTRYSNIEVSEAARSMQGSFKALTQIFKEIDEVWLDPNMDPQQKLQRINELYREKANEAREAYRDRPGASLSPTGQLLDNIRGLPPAEAVDWLRANEYEDTADLVAGLPRQPSASLLKALKESV